MFGQPQITLSGVSNTILRASNHGGRPHYETGAYVEKDDYFIDWIYPDASWWYEWSTDKAGVVYAYWQVSVLPFNDSGEDWANA
ncbi:MAG: hypothetical protein AB1420_07555 [Bacillota bacterium]